MKQVGIIRISLFFCATLTICAFWSGFYYGKTQAGPESTAMENTLESYTVRETVDSRESVLDLPETEEETVDSMTALSAEAYYLRADGEYLSVYRGTSGDVYFETDLKPEDLPETLQEQLETGLEFDSLEELYSFLENYSS